MEKNAFKKAISKLKPKQKECCNIEIKENDRNKNKK